MFPTTDRTWAVYGSVSCSLFIGPIYTKASLNEMSGADINYGYQTTRTTRTLINSDIQLILVQIVLNMW